MTIKKPNLPTNDYLKLEGEDIAEILDNSEQKFVIVIPGDLSQVGRYIVR